MALKEIILGTALMSVGLMFLNIPDARAEEIPDPSLAAIAEEPASLIPFPSETRGEQGKERVFWSLSSGMVIRELAAGGRIAGAKEPKLMFSEGDLVYLVLAQEQPPSQNEWVVFRKTKSVYHPATGKLVGDLIEVNGLVRIVERQGQSIIARVLHSKGPISVNDKIVSQETLLAASSSAQERQGDKKEGTIIEFKDNRVNNGEQDIVYIDRGRKDGLLPGDRFQVIHGGQETGARVNGEKVRLPKRSAGRILILSTQEHTATALITESSEIIAKGDPLIYLPKE